jgi:DNA modification methylase
MAKNRNHAAAEKPESAKNDPVKCAGESAAEWARVDSLTPWEKNPRKNDEAVKAVADSIKRLGFGAPIVARRADRSVIAGHTRLKAAQMLGLDVVPVRFVDLDPVDARLMAIADNKLGEKAEWDNALLGEVLSEFSLDDAALAGFDSAELEKLGSSLLGGSVDESIDAEPQLERADELLKEWNVETGQLWGCGAHRILCGDSSQLADVDRLLGKLRATLVFTDPPYGVSIGAKNRMLNKFGTCGRTTTDIADDSLSPQELKAKLLPAFQIIQSRVMADDCTVFVTAPQGGDLGMMMMMMAEAKLTARHVLIWKKNSPTFSMGRLDYDYQHEPILLTWGKRHKRPMLGEHKTSVWEIDKPSKSKEHPTMKPVELPVNALLNNSDAGDVVFDGYSGSGTTLIACAQTGRVARVIEIEPKYVAVALQRYQDATGDKPELLT